jgi:type IV pilus assembly protein PilP
MPLTPLERVDLSQLKLVGIIQAPSGNKALVEEASGKGYIIKKGTFIGIHAGRVLEIQKDRVVVEEEVENVLGQFALDKKELKLQKPPGEF